MSDFKEFIEEIITKSPTYKNLDREEALIKMIEWYANWVSELHHVGSKISIEVWDEDKNLLKALGVDKT